MPNPYHDSEGKFCSKNEMKQAIQTLVQENRVNEALALQAEYSKTEAREEDAKIKAAKKKAKMISQLIHNPSDALSYMRKGEPLDESFSPELFHKIYKKHKDNRMVTEFLANHRETPYKILYQLADCEDDDSRIILAQKNNLSSELEQKLANDEHEYVRMLIAEKKDTSVEILEKLSTDKEDSVSYAALRNPSYPLSRLEERYATGASGLASFIALRSGASTEMLQKIMSNGIHLAPYHIARHKNATPEMLTELAKIRKADLREVIAQNPNSPKEVLLALSKMKSLNTASYALETLKVKKV